MNSVWKYCLLTLICVGLFAQTASAQKLFRPRDELIDKAMDGAEKTYSSSYARELSRKIAVRKALDEMPYKPTKRPRRSLSYQNDLPQETQIQETNRKKHIEAKEDAVLKPVPQVNNPTPLPPVKAADRKPIKDKDSLHYRYIDLENPQNEVEVGTEVFDYTYREEGFMKLDGMMYGVFMNYQHRYHENPGMTKWSDFMHTGKPNLLKVDARFAGGGDIKYRSEGTGIHEGEDHYVFETRVMGGYELPWKKRNMLFVPYAGLGYRYLLDDNGGTQTTSGAWNYDRESNYFYVPLGLETHKFFQNGWKTRLTMEYDLFLGGRQYSHYEDVPGYTETLYNQQTTGYGLRSALRLSKEGERFEFFVEPFARYWHIDDSESGSTSEVSGIEPNNRTQEYGARLGVKF